MFQGFTPQTIDFMKNLRINNRKDWFEENKETFKQEFQIPMKLLGDEVYQKMKDEFADRDFILKGSRIYRDARRVRDGQPYRCNLWFTIQKQSDESGAIPVFWFNISPEEWSYGMGYYAPKASTMTKYRTLIDQETEEFELLILKLDSQDEFFLEGEEYKRVKVAPTEKTATWYNRKGISLSHVSPISDLVYSRELVDRIVEGYRFLMPFYDYFVAIDFS